MKRLIVAVMLAPCFASAYVIGGTNFDFRGYPEPNCIKPIRPNKPYSFNSQWEVDSYNRQVESFNMQYDMYVDCVKTYLDNASKDIDRIKEKMKSAIDDARGV